MTWRINEAGLLEWGAVISNNLREWEFAREVRVPQRLDEGDAFEESLYVTIGKGYGWWSFMDDPFEVPAGEARVSGFPEGLVFYIHEGFPGEVIGNGSQRAFRILSLDDYGALSEVFRMVWTDSGGPFIEGSILQRTVSRIPREVYHRVESPTHQNSPTNR